MKHKLDGSLLSYLIVDVRLNNTEVVPKASSCNHKMLNEALAIHNQLISRNTFLTHIGHDLHCELMQDLSISSSYSGTTHKYRTFLDNLIIGFDRLTMKLQD